MKTRSLLWISVLVALFGSGCGGNEPLLALGDPTAVPTLILPLSLSVGFTVSQQYSATSEGIILNYTPATPTSVLAPAAGIITKVDPNLDPGLYAITIYHNAFYSTRLSRLVSPPILRVGDVVAAGSNLGSITNSFVMITVFANNGSVCPLSLLATDARQKLTSLVSNPCL